MLTILKNIITIVVLMIVFLAVGTVRSQLDDRFGTKGVEGTKYLGQNGLNWYRDWDDSYLPTNYPPVGKNKFWTVGKIDYRTDKLGIDYRWIILDLLEDTEVDLLQKFLDLCLAVVDTNIVPIISDYWTKTKPLLETQLEDTLNHFTYTEKKYGVKYRAKCKNTDIIFQETLPEFVLTVKQDTIILNTSIKADWKTHIYIEAWILNPNPFNWGYYWEDIGDADCKFQTTIHITGFTSLEKTGRERHLQVKRIVPISQTESDIDWSVFGISFTWEKLSNSIEDLIDDEIEKALSIELNKSPITDPYYFVDFFKPLFSDGIVPTQQEILDQIWNEEQSHIIETIQSRGYKGGYWSIGYEPNWFPMLDPDQYAAFYTNYYKLIKELDPDAKVMGPPVLLTEAMENFEEIAWLFIPDIFQGFLLGIRDEFKKLVNSYFEIANSKTWYREFFNHLPSDVKVDVNDFHVFPINANYQTIDWDSLSSQINDMANFMREINQVDEVWVSEFGNIDRKRSEEQVAVMCRGFCQYFKSNTVGIQRWFWFLSKGHSPFYDIPFMPNPPITALLNDNFTLTQVGKVYLYEADITPPIMESSPMDQGRYTNPEKIAFNWNEAKEYDTGIADYKLEVIAKPGNIKVFDKWIGNRLSQTITYYNNKTLYARVQAKNNAGLIGDWSEWSDGITIIPVDIKDIDIADNSTSEENSDGKDLLNNAADDNEEFSSETDLAKSDAELSAVARIATGIPDLFKISQNYPNPFNSSTTINYHLAEDGQVSIKIFNVRGEEIRTLVNEFKRADYYTVHWNGKDEKGNLIVSGVYLYQIQAGKHICTKKMVFVE